MSIQPGTCHCTSLVFELTCRGKRSIEPPADFCDLTVLVYLNEQITLKSWMDDFEASGKLTLTGELLKQAQSEFISACIHPQQNLDNIKAQWEQVSHT